MPRKLYFIESIYTGSNPDEQEVDVVWIPAEGTEVYNPEFRSFNSQQFMISEPGDIQEGQYVYYNDDPDLDTSRFTDGTYSLYAQREIGLSVYYRAELLHRAAQGNNEWLQREQHLDYDDSEVYSFHVNVGHGNCSLILIKQEAGYHLWMVDCSLYEMPNRIVKWTNHEYTFENTLNTIASMVGKSDRTELFIDHFLLTHMHYDHFNGLKYLISQQYVTSRTIFYMNLQYQMPSKNLNEILKMMIDNHMSRLVEPVISNSSPSITILHPECRIYKNQASMLEYAPKFRFVSNPNNSSAVFALRLSGMTMVFPGDLEREGFETMIKTHKCSHDWASIDFFAVSHHGSLNGLPIKQYQGHKKPRNMLHCFRRKLKIAIIMARDGAYKGIISKRIISIYDILTTRGVWQTDTLPSGSVYDYLLINWQDK